MNKAIQIENLKFGIPILIILFLAVLPKTGGFQNAPEELSFGILLDFLITIPVIYYLLIRKTKIPNFTTIYMFLICLLLAGLIIPKEEQQLLSMIKLVVIPVIEIGIIGTIIYKFVRLKASFKKSKVIDFYDSLLIACNEVFPDRLGKILATEIAVVYYLFVPTREKTSNGLEFTYHKKSGIKLIISIFLFLIMIETIVVHLLISKWYIGMAWVLSALGVYTMIQVISILRSMNNRLITIDYETESVHLRYGFGCQSTIRFKSIARIEKSRRSLTNDKSNVDLSLFDILDSRNVIIYLKEENTLQKIYGIEKKYKSISLFIDDVDLFINEMEQIIIER